MTESGNLTYDSFQKLKPFIKEGMEDEAYIKYCDIWQEVIRKMGGSW